MQPGRPFHFRHFSLMHHRSTMKVGTDAVLLGAWITPWEAVEILDVGTGSGILALMLAQRSAARIEAIDIDQHSVEEASFNFACSQWNNRLKATKADFTDFSLHSEKKYCLIVSNPPFFTSFYKTRHQRRNLARHTDTLSFHELITGTLRLLKPSGRLCLVLPHNEGLNFIKLAEKHGLYEQNRMDIISVEGRQPNRMNLELSLQKSTQKCPEEFVIRHADGRFTKQYIDLLQDYYLGL